jgi:hypothetical protein
MSRRPRLTGAARVAERRRENLDMFLGVLGFFTALIFVSTAVAEIRGEASLAKALTLGIFVVLMYVTLRLRRTLHRRASGVDQSPGTGPVRGDVHS